MRTGPPHVSPERRMKVCYVNAFYDEADPSPDEFIERVFTVRELAREQANLGAEVHVLQLFHCDAVLVRDGVTYWFSKPSAVSNLAARGLAALRRSTPPAHFRVATSLVDRLVVIGPDVVHFFGLALDLNLRLVANAARRHGIPLVVQHNGGEPPANRLRRALQRGNLRRADKVLFTTREHARPWLDAGMPLDPARVVQLMETSSTLTWQPRDEARRVTGMTGDPVFLWTGRLHVEKDPFTALRGFARFVDTLPGARLYMHYLTDELLPDLRRYVAECPRLVERVQFRGRVEYAEMAAIYNSADFFLQASTRETSGLAVLEAMSCGVIPVVTDIPSFRSMTAGGQFGKLFPVGDHLTLAREVLSVSQEEIPWMSKQVRRRFHDAVSFPALSRQLCDLYRELLDESTQQVDARVDE